MEIIESYRINIYKINKEITNYYCIYNHSLRIKLIILRKILPKLFKCWYSFSQFDNFFNMLQRLNYINNIPIIFMRFNHPFIIGEFHPFIFRSIIFILSWFRFLSLLELPSSCLAFFMTFIGSWMASFMT
jgi:hypothetical protein